MFHTFIIDVLTFWRVLFQISDHGFPPDKSRIDIFLRHSCDVVKDSIDASSGPFSWLLTSDLSENKATYAVFNNMTTIPRYGPIKTAGIDRQWTLRTERAGSWYRSSRVSEYLLIIRILIEANNTQKNWSTVYCGEYDHHRNPPIWWALLITWS